MSGMIIPPYIQRLFDRLNEIANAAVKVARNDEEFAKIAQTMLETTLQKEWKEAGLYTPDWSLYEITWDR